MKLSEKNRSYSKVYFPIFLLVLIASVSPLIPQERFRKSPPYPEPLPELVLPEIKSAFLSNGLAISVLHQDIVPVISLRLIILSGESSSPEEFPGLATLTANMLNKGVMTISSSGIEEIIESIGGNLSISAYSDYSVFTLTFLEEYLDEALDILSKMILQPTFIGREIESVKRIMYYDMIKKVSDPEYLAKRQLFRLLFKNHPYKKSTYNEDVIKYLNKKSLLDFFDKYYRPNNALLVLTGNINLPTATRKVSHYFNTWKKKDLEHPFIPPPEPYDKQKICFIDLPQVKDATIYMGNVILTRTNPDFFPLIVLNQVLGGTPNSRLFMNLRESKGYAYYAFSELEFFKSCGISLIRAKVRPEVIYDSIQESFEEIEKITKTRIPNIELEQAKSYLIGNFPLKIETFANLSSKVSEIKAFNLGEEHWSEYYENIMVVNSEKVFEIAQRYPLLTPVVVIVGDKNIILDHLMEFEELEMYDIKGVLKQTFTKGEDQ